MGRPKSGQDDYESYVRGIQRSERGELVQEYWGNRVRTLDCIDRSARRGDLALVLGAGVSVPSKLPAWPELVERLVEKALSAKKSALATRLRRVDIPEHRRTRIIESLIPGFRLTVRDELYQGKRHKNSTLKAIVALAERVAKTRRHLRIVTYNFDDLLERELDASSLRGRYGVVSSQATFDAYRKRKHGLTIFHPHGYLPERGDVEALLQSLLIFSERQYHRSYFAVDHWANVIQRELFSTASCLFIGCSFNDQDQRRLLDQVNTDAAPSLTAIMRRTHKYRRTLTNELTDFIIQHDLSLLNVKPIWVKEWKEVSPILARLLK